MEAHDADFILGLILPQIQRKFDEATKIDDTINHNIVLFWEGGFDIKKNAKIDNAGIIVKICRKQS